MDDDLYDEFGNFIGEDAGASDEESDHGVDANRYVYDDEPEEAPAIAGQDLMEIDDGPSNAVVLHEDKQYYPTAAQVYGDGVQVLVQDEDAQPLTQPIIAPVEQKKFHIEEADLPPVFFDRSFMTDLMSYPDQIRNVVLAGHLHHGKTAFMDMLVMETHDLAGRLEKRQGKRREVQLRYTDVHTVERDRGVSIKAAPMTLVLPDSRDKSHLINIIDTPGHVDFVDEVAASIRLADGLCLVVDVLEGVQVNTERIIKHAVLEGVPITLILNKMDRLILELKLPPTDAYYKLKYVIEEVNAVIERTLPGQQEQPRISPEKGNVLFASTSLAWCFTLESFAKMYSDNSSGVNTQDFARRLWGNIYFNPSKRTFTRKGLEEGSRRSFVTFVLEPLYKLFSHVISESPDELKGTLEELGIRLKPSQLRSDAKVLLKMACEQFFGPCTGFVDMVCQHVPSPVSGAEKKLQRYYTGPMDTKLADSMRKCDQDGPLVVYVTKLFNTADAKSFFAFGRVMSGVVRPGMEVRVLGEGYSLDDEEDMAAASISGVVIGESRYNVPTDGVPAGNWVMLAGVDNSIVKTATIIQKQLENNEDVYIFKPVTHFTESVFKVAVEPVNPSELPKMLDGIRKINKSYPLITTKVEESGEHVILGTGELYMDCVLHDLRRLYADMDIRVSDPVVRFCETVQDTSATKCDAITPNKKNTITMTAEPLEDGIARDIESGAVRIRDPVRKTAEFFQDKYGWDRLAARSIWAFGPEETGPNILQDYTIPSEVDKKLLNTVKDSIRQGFSWATREGPLCEEPMRNTKFRLMDISLAQDAIFRGGGQIIPTSRRACYSSFLLASPRLVEPIYALSVTGPQNSVSVVYNMLTRRRGHVLSDGPVAGTPLFRVDGLLPVIDSFGFETDLRISAHEGAAVSLVFDRWDNVPGDPLDRDIILRPLQMASVQSTARDFVLKTRRRKGLSDDVSVAKFLEPELYQELRENKVLGDV